MRNFILILSFILFSMGIANAQYTLIPDANFEAALSSYDDVSGDGQVPTANIATVTTLALKSKSISDLGGIEDFTALETLNMRRNNLTTIDLSQNTNLVWLNVSNNSLTALDLTTNVNLVSLYCVSNSLTTIDVSNNLLLSQIYLSSNSIDSLDLTNHLAVTELECVACDLTNLDVKNSNNVNITYFDITDNANLACVKVDDVVYSTTNWTSKDAGTNYSNYCNYTTVPDLNFELALEELGYDDVSEDGQVPTELISVITSLDVSNKNISNSSGIEDFVALNNLNFLNNNLAELDISFNSLLETLNVSENSFTSLNLSGSTTLLNINVSSNNLSYLNIKNGNNVNITDFDATDNASLTCIIVDDISYAVSNFTKIDDHTNFGDTACRYTQIPDINFENALEALGYDDFSDDGRVPTTLIEVLTNLTLVESAITDLTGIEEFTSLEVLTIKGNSIETLDLSGNTVLQELYATSIFAVNGSLDVSNTSSLRKIQCKTSTLTSINLSSAVALEELNLDSNELTSLNLSNNNNSLKIVSATSNSIASININSVTALEELYLDGNELESLGLSTNVNLVELSCSTNKLISLDVSNNVALEVLDFSDNNLRSLNVANGNNNIITYFDTEVNPNLTCILVDDATYSIANWTEISEENTFNDVACINYTQIPDLNFELALEYIGKDNISGDGQVPTSYIEDIITLDMSGKSITDLTGIEDFIALKTLVAYGNQLTTVDLSSNTELTEIDFYNNQLTALDLSKNTLLVNVFVDSNNITSLDLTNNTLAVNLSLNDNNLISLDLRNGNNEAIASDFNITNNPNLSCILVDDITYATNNFTNIDAQTSFSESECIAYTAIPDANFEAELEALGYDDITNDGRVPTSNIEGVKVLTVVGKSITDLTGIENFTALTELKCRNNLLTDLDVSQNVNLELLDFSQNFISQINITNNVNLVRFDCYENNLTTLGISHNILLEEFSCYDNTINTIDLSANSLLKFIDVINNGLTTIDISNNLQLTEIFFSKNAINSLDLSSHTLLTFVECTDCSLTSLDVANGNNTSITYLNILNNPDLTCVKVDDASYSATNWTSLDATTSFSDTFCEYTQIPDANFEGYLFGLGYDDITNDQQVPTALIKGVTNLDASTKGITDPTGIEDFVALTSLNFGDNAIASIDLNQNLELQYLNLNDNELINLDISNNPALTTFICSNNTELTEITLGDIANITLFSASNNALTGLDLSSLTALEDVYISDNNLSYLNIKNGNNTNIVDFDATNNSGLECITVDDVTYATNNFTDIDDQTSFSLNACRYTQIPDAIFEGVLFNLGYDDISGDGQVPTALIEVVVNLSVDGGISDLTGIEDFTSLEILDVSANYIVNLDLSGNTRLQELTAVSAFNNGSLDISNTTALRVVNCIGSNLQSINATNAIALEALNVSNTILSSLDVSTNTTLKTLECAETGLKTINLNGAIALEELVIYSNTLTSIDLSTNVLLTDLNCAGNNIVTLNLSNNLALTLVNVNENELLNFNIQNGNNAVITSFNATGNSNLSCILVDDISADFSAWTKDDVANYNNVACTEYTSIPDTNFEAALGVLGYDDITNDGKVPTALITNVTSLDVSGNSIADMTGIEGFSSLTTLKATQNPFLTLDLSQNTVLENLDVSHTSTENLEVSSNTALKIIRCNSTSITTINLGGVTALEELYVYSTTLTALDVSNNINLKIIHCYETRDLENINLNRALALEELDVANSSINSLDISTNIALINLSCGSTDITTLDLSNNTVLESLSIQNGGLTSLNIKNGNNTNITAFSIVANGPLYCIRVDDAAYSTANWTNIESTMSFSDTYCRYTQIPDANFEAKLESLGYDDISEDGQVPTALIETVTSLDAQYEDISDFTGLEDFVALESLTISYNSFTTLDVSSNTHLTNLNCGYSGLTSLDVSNNLLLETLWVDNTQVDTLDLSLSTNLTYLVASSMSNLTSLNIQNGNNSNVTRFTTIGSSNITCVLVDDATYSTTNWIDIESTTLFSEIHCNYTQIPDANFEAKLENLGYDDISGDGQVPTANIEILTFLDISDEDIADLSGLEDFTALDALVFTNNSFTEVDLSANINLRHIDGDHNNITNINLEGLTLLEAISLYDNPLTTIDLSTNIKLNSFLANESGFTSLDFSNNPLMDEIEVNDSQLTYVNLQNGTNITSNIYIDFRDNPTLTCVLVDDAAYSTTNWTRIGSQTSFNEVACSLTLSLEVEVFLQGPAVNHNTGEESLMRDDLRVADYLPTTSPYSDGLTCETTIFDVTGNNAIVDWIWIELREETDSSVVSYSQSALLQRDGDVVTIDGVSNVVFTTTSDTYYMSLNHRNHLGIITSNAITATGTDLTIDFTASNTLVEGEANAVVDLGSGVYAMIAGDYDENTQIQNSEVPFLVLLLGESGYDNADIDLNTQIQNTDINLVLKSNIGKGEQISTTVVD